VKQTTQTVNKDMLIRSANGCKQQHKKLIRKTKKASVVTNSFQIAQKVLFVRSLPSQKNVYKKCWFRHRIISQLSMVTVCHILTVTLGTFFSVGFS